MAGFVICASVILATASILIGVWARREMKRSREAFEEQFPPISDAEFLACCGPGVNPEVALKVREIIADYFGVEYERVHPSMRLVDLG